MYVGAVIGLEFVGENTRDEVSQSFSEIEGSWYSPQEEAETKSMAKVFFEHLKPAI